MENSNTNLATQDAVYATKRFLRILAQPYEAVCATTSHFVFPVLPVQLSCTSPLFRMLLCLVLVDLSWTSENFFIYNSEHFPRLLHVHFACLDFSNFCKGVFCKGVIKSPLICFFAQDDNALMSADQLKERLEVAKKIEEMEE